MTLWGHKIGEPTWHETLISVGDGSEFQAAKEWAEANGFDRFRVMDENDGVNPWENLAGMVNKL